MAPHQTIAVAVRLFSVWLATYTVQDIVTFYLADTSRNYPDALPISIAVFLFTAVAIALWLIFGTKGIKKLFLWAQTAGQNRSP
jgi:hypothetical protein